MRPVYVLDYELISPIGVGREETWKNLESDYLAGRQIRQFNAEGLPASHGAEVDTERLPSISHFEPTLLQAAKLDRKLTLTLASLALVETRFQSILSTVAEERRGISYGVGLDITPIEFLVDDLRPWLQDPQGAYFHVIRERNATGTRLNQIANPLDIHALYLGHRLRLGAFQKTVLTACSASLQSVAFGANAIRRDEADFVVVGGSDSLLNLAGYVAFSRLGVVLPISCPPEKACKPLDINRAGVLVGEGSGLILLASEKGAKLSGLQPRAELSGWANSMDGYKITAPDPEGKGMRRAIEGAIRASHVKPDEIDYVNLHGTGTRANDPAELKALVEALGEAGNDVAVSSTKDRHGHMIGAAGVMELGLLLMCMEHSFIPCTRNLEKPILDRGLRLVRGVNERRRIRNGMTNSFALGGVNSSMVVKNLN